jgi:Lrp/AsnC family transcriptional regulator for asnA, asnC and gidA
MHQPNGTSVDGTDREIIKILQVDGRKSHASIARQLNLSEGTIRRRVKHLIEENYISVTCTPNSSKLGNNSEALIGMQVTPNKVGLVIQKLTGMEEVTWFCFTTGDHDIFAWVKLPSTTALGKFLIEELGSTPGILRTKTFVSLGDANVNDEEKKKLQPSGSVN